jgi:hypothetical protein
MKDRYQENISFRGVVIILLGYKSILVKRWKIIFLAGLLMGIGGVIYAWLDQKVYKAELTFALEDKSSAGGYASLANQFGIDLSKGGEGGAFKGDNIIELFKSVSMVESTLLSSATFDGKTELLIERYFEKNKMTLDDKIFDYHKPRNNFSVAEDSLLQIISNGIIKNNLDWEKTDKSLAIVKFRFKSTDEIFAKIFIEKLTQVVCDFFTETKTKKIKSNIILLESRIDSVRQELDKEMGAAASSQDQNQNAAVARVRIPLMKRQMNIQLLTTLYGELTRNIELSKMSLVKEEPLIQIIDRPRLPLKFEKKSRAISGIIFFIIGSFLASFYFIGSTIYRNFSLSLKDIE